MYIGLDVAGRRISSVQIEKIIATHPAVQSCAVVAVTDDLRGQKPVAYVVPEPEFCRLISATDIVALVSQTLGRWVGLKDVHFVQHLPTTQSGKILRKHLRRVVS